MEPLTTADVQAALDILQLNIAIQVFEASTRTAQDAADVIGTALGSIVKTLVFEINGQIVVILTSGDKKVDTRKLATYFGVGRKKVKVATAEQCVGVIGYAPGGVPPLGHRGNVPLYIDEMLSRFDTLYAAGGTANTIFPIPYRTLVQITNGTVMDVVRTDD